MMKACAALLLLLAACGAAHAERADTFQPTTVLYREAYVDFNSGKKILVGDVELRRGTLHIRAQRGELTEDEQGYQHLVLTAVPGGAPVWFRQKRDGNQEQWMEGEGRKVTYDGAAEVVDLYHEARVRRTTEGDLTDEVTGEHITYKSRLEQFQVVQLPGAETSGDRRGMMVLQPSRKDPLSTRVPASAAVTQP